jgi:hypothetical protein
MERKEFMKSIGAGAAFAVTFGCWGGCLREELEPLNEIIPTAENPASIDSPVETTPLDTTTINTPPPETTPPATLETTSEISPTEPAPETSTLPENALFTIDLTSSVASNLASKGGYIIKDNIVIAQNLSGEYVAATVICSHCNYYRINSSGLPVEVLKASLEITPNISFKVSF